MEDEVILTGYCRCLDQSRMVTVEVYNGATEVDCSYGSCPYEASCAIAEKTTEFQPRTAKFDRS